MASGKDIDTSTTEGLPRPIEQPHDPGPAKHDRAKNGDGKHEMPDLREGVDDETSVGRVMRQQK